LLTNATNSGDIFGAKFVVKYWQHQFSKGGAREERFSGAMGRQMAVAIAQKLL
jgi:hypothetical protein